MGQKSMHRIVLRFLLRIVVTSFVFWSGVCAWAFLPSLAMAASGAQIPEADFSEEDDSKTTTRLSASGASLEDRISGFFIEARAGGGTMVLNESIEENIYFPQLSNVSEGLGAGTQLEVGLGYDISERIALELLLGGAFISGTRSDIVIDLSVVYAALGVRIGIPLAERLDLSILPAAGYAISDTSLEQQSGPYARLGVGIEYFVHLRHFSLGIELAATAPNLTQLSRLFIGVSPHVKYTF